MPGDTIGDEFKGYIFKITGGNDKQGFPMKNVFDRVPANANSVGCSPSHSRASSPFKRSLLLPSPSYW